MNLTSSYMQELTAATQVQAPSVDTKITLRPQVNGISIFEYNIYFEAEINTSDKVTLTYYNKFFKQSGFKPNSESEVVEILLEITKKMEDYINAHGFTKVTISTDYLNTYLTSKYNDNIYLNQSNQSTFSSNDFINSTINKDFTLQDIIYNTNIFTLLPIVKSPNFPVTDNIILLIPNFFFLPQIINIFNSDLLNLVDVARKNPNPNPNPMFNVYPIIEMLHNKMLKLHNMFQASTTPKLSYIKFIASFILSNFMFNIYNNTYLSSQRQTAALIMYDITVDILKLHTHNNCAFVSTILQFNDKICVSQSCPICSPEKPCVQVAPSNIMLYIFIGLSIFLFIILIIVLFNQYYNT